MCKEVTKFFISASVALILGACSDTEKIMSEKLLGEANTETQNGNFDRAIELLDSLDRTYPKQVDNRREGMHLKTKAKEGSLLSQISKNDSTLAILEVKKIEISNSLDHVDNPVEGYYVAKGMGSVNLAKTPGIHARMSPEGLFYIISSTNKNVKSTSVGVSAGESDARTPEVPNDGERNDRSLGFETITFMPSESDSIGHFVAENNGNAMKLTFYGTNTYSMALPQEQAEAVATLYNASKTIREFQRRQMLKLSLEKQLSLTRSQMARTFRESE